MKTMLSAAAAVALMTTLASAQGAVGTAGGTQKADEAAVRSLGEKYSAAWNSGNARAAAALFAEDGSYTRVTGETLNGRVAIEKSLIDDPIGTARTGQRLSVGTEAVRFLADDLAVGTGRTVVKGATPADDGGGHFMVVAKRIGPEWKILAVHAAVSPPAMAQPAVEAASMTGTSGRDSADEEAILALEREWLDAIEKADVAKLDRILGDDFIEVGPAGAYQDKATSLAETQKGDMVFESISLEDAKTRVFGNAALLVGTGKVKASYKGEDVSGTYRWTDAFVKRNGRWVAVSGHVNRVMEPAR